MGWQTNLSQAINNWDNAWLQFDKDGEFITKTNNEEMYELYDYIGKMISGFFSYKI